MPSDNQTSQRGKLRSGEEMNLNANQNMFAIASLRPLIHGMYVPSYSADCYNRFGLSLVRKCRVFDFYAKVEKFQQFSKESLKFDTIFNSLTVNV